MDKLPCTAHRIRCSLLSPLSRSNALVALACLVLADDQIMRLFGLPRAVCGVLLPQLKSNVAVTAALLLKVGFETARELFLLYPRVAAVAPFALTEI